jgi:DNA-binding NtrC family response regulator
LVSALQPHPGVIVRKRLLVVDAHLQTVDALVDHFAPQYTVYTAVNGADALVVVRRARPDLVILDLDLTDMPGLDLLRKIKGQTPSLPIIVLTANAAVRAVTEALQLGAFAYVAKPSSVQYLDHLIAAALGVAPVPQGPA